MASKALSPLKAKPLRNPGQSVNEEIQARLDDEALPYLMITMMLWMIALMEWIGALREAPRRPLAYAIGAAIVTLWTAHRIINLRKEIRALKQGRDGEMAVGQFLEGLRSDGARIFHDIPGEGFNLDHVVISQHGIFVVETKTLSKPGPKAKITIDGDRLLAAGRKMDRDPVQQVRAQVSWLARILKETTGRNFPVKGAVVFPGWFVEPVPSESNLELWVLEPKALPAFIEKQAVCIESSDVTLAAFHLSRYVRTAQ